MSTFNIVSRYAKALLELAVEKDELNRIADDLQTVNVTLRDSKELKVFLRSPVFKDEQKHDVIDAVFKEKISSDSLQFIHFILDKGRENYLFEITERFLELRDKKLGIVNISTRSSVEFEEDQKNSLKTKLEEYTGRKVKISYSIDESLIGGFIVRIGDTILDASVKRQLELLRNKFLKESISLN